MVHEKVNKSISRICQIFDFPHFISFVHKVIFFKSEQSKNKWNQIIHSTALFIRYVWSTWAKSFNILIFNLNLKKGMLQKIFDLKKKKIHLEKTEIYKFPMTPWVQKFNLKLKERDVTKNIWPKKKKKKYILKKLKYRSFQVYRKCSLSIEYTEYIE